MRQLQSALCIHREKNLFDGGANPAGIRRISSRRSDGDIQQPLFQRILGEERMQPAATIRCEPPSLSITPYPVRSVPQSMPSTRIRAQASGYALRLRCSSTSKFE